ncbi:ABC transporter substrate-binding protein [Sphaerisporangium sp. NPDC051011]|uniref:ABC transporter substrate-binding protein n=1 Tax=Sphaerisporangium sp. NPDC051011 TaxID=3155792 RepID=UPI0033C51761
MRRFIAAALMVALSVPALVSCGDSASDDGSDAGAGGTVPVTFAALSIAQAAPLVLGEKRGIFKDNGIDFKIEFVEPAAVIPGVVSGQYDVGLLNAPAVLAARANKVPVKSVATASATTGDPADFPIQIVVPVGSAIRSPKDLVGKKVATDTLYQLPDLGMRSSLMASGVDPKSLDIVEIPFPDMGTALREGKVDAAAISEPFGTILRDSGAIRDLLSTSIGQPEGSPQSVIVSSERYIGKNPNVIAKFQKAVDEALKYAATHDDEMRATLPGFTKLDAKLAAAIRFVPPSGDDTLEGWQAWADILVKTGVVKAPIDVKAAYVPVG